jgi:hypothetical protein
MKNAICCLTLLTSVTILSLAQNVTSSVQGMVVDQSDAAVPGAVCTLTGKNSGRVMTSSSWTDGTFTFAAVQPGIYELKIKAPGFKVLTVDSVAVDANQVRTLGKLRLEVGDVAENVTVTAEATPIQLATAEKSGTISGAQLANIYFSGRDPYGILAIIPGIMDTGRAREITTNLALESTFINGGRARSINFTVDGVFGHNSSNGSIVTQPNMEAIDQIKVLTTSYQAEYGRQAFGVVSVITKSGTREFHGTLFGSYRHESLNANDFFRNRSGTPKNRYRYAIPSYSVGGPVYIPRLFNADRSRLFFFWSQEFSGVTQDHGTVFANTPTLLERSGDFSQSFDSAGRLIPVRDPSTGSPFPGNRIPAQRINPLGRKILDFFPQPNYTDPDPRYLYYANLRSSYSGKLEKRNDVLRLDVNLTRSLTFYYRYLHDKDISLIPWRNWQVNTNFWLTPVRPLKPGWGHVAHLTYTISPTLVNELKVGSTYHSLYADYQDPSAIDRSKIPGIPRWNPHPEWPNYLPDLQFGGPVSNPVNLVIGPQPWYYRDRLLAVTENITKVQGRHTFKAGFNIERRFIRQHTMSGAWRGAYYFGRDTNNPLDANHPFATALLGNFSRYNEINKRAIARLRDNIAEWYVQDNWRVSRRLTLDVGLRFYHFPPARDLNRNLAVFSPSRFQPSKAPQLYAPAFDSRGVRVARDPLSGELAPAVLIGMLVPGSGDFANGSRVCGEEGIPQGCYQVDRVALGPRLGFAYDLTGDGKTALRGGFGMFIDRVSGNEREGNVGNVPVAYLSALYYSDMSTIAQGKSGLIGPPSIYQTTVGDRVRLPGVISFSLGIQRQLLATVVDASYVGSLSRHVIARPELNPIPMYGRFDPRNADPTRPGSPLPDNFFRLYRGYGSILIFDHAFSSNYHSLQVSAERRFRRGLHYGLAYTWSKTLGISAGDWDTVSPYFPVRRRNYGPLFHDRRHRLVVNYFYELPEFSAPNGWKVLGWVVNGWVVGGWTTFSTGAPFTPGFSTTDGQDITGSSEGPRINVIGNPVLPKSERTFFRNFNTDAFARPALGDFGNAGIGILYGPGDNNWDLAVTKRVPLMAEGRYIQFRASFMNVWNHTRFASYHSHARFDPTGKQVEPLFGAFNSTRNPRIGELSLRLVF